MALYRLWSLYFEMQEGCPENGHEAREPPRSGELRADDRGRSNAPCGRSEIHSPDRPKVRADARQLAAGAHDKEVAQPCSAYIQSHPVEMVHKPTFGLADLNEPDSVMFAGMLT